METIKTKIWKSMYHFQKISDDEMQLFYGELDSIGQIELDIY